MAIFDVVVLHTTEVSCTQALRVSNRVRSTAWEWAISSIAKFFL